MIILTFLNIWNQVKLIFTWLIDLPWNREQHLNINIWIIDLHLPYWAKSLGPQQPPLDREGWASLHFQPQKWPRRGHFAPWRCIWAQPVEGGDSIDSCEWVSQHTPPAPLAAGHCNMSDSGANIPSWYRLLCTSSCGISERILYQGNFQFFKTP